MKTFGLTGHDLLVVKLRPYGLSLSISKMVNHYLWLSKPGKNTNCF